MPMGGVMCRSSLTLTLALALTLTLALTLARYSPSELRLGTRSTLFAAVRMSLGSNETTRLALRELGTWHGDSASGRGQMVSTARGKQMWLEMV